jgi:O-phosphoseryl-tRNA(Cys) synthetase
MGNLKTYKKVELNGKEYLLKFDYNSQCDLEEIFGKGIAAILNEEQIGFRLVRAFYWAGLKWKEKGITLDRVGNMLGKEIQENDKNIMELMEPVMDALKKSKLLGTAKDEDEEEAETEQEEKEDENPNE